MCRVQLIGIDGPKIAAHILKGNVLLFLLKLLKGQDREQGRNRLKTKEIVI